VASGRNYTSYAIAPIDHSQRYFIFFCVSFFALGERKKRNTDKTESTMLPYILSLTKGRLKGV